ncbi:hypothetical protein U5U50_01990 [Mycoplasma sp. 888]|uniref:hypothetical protein n=1 Tax=Mycoplasma sp. 888 TaxID=3108483 RepID=UPI002D79EA6B|nr:hypothetical protein [Mycoplasma sp. 888]WRQ25566.1 hypothetical protein U5U50_01990 [Mycoplasma sp. 888]
MSKSKNIKRHRWFSHTELLTGFIDLKTREVHKVLITNSLLNKFANPNPNIKDDFSSFSDSDFTDKEIFENVQELFNNKQTEVDFSTLYQNSNNKEKTKYEIYTDAIEKLAIGKITDVSKVANFKGKMPEYLFKAICFTDSKVKNREKFNIDDILKKDEEFIKNKKVAEYLKKFFEKGKDNFANYPAKNHNYFNCKKFEADNPVLWFVYYFLKLIFHDESLVKIFDESETWRLWWYIICSNKTENYPNSLTFILANYYHFYAETFLYLKTLEISDFNHIDSTEGTFSDKKFMIDLDNVNVLKPFIYDFKTYSDSNYLKSDRNIHKLCWYIYIHVNNGTNKNHEYNSLIKSIEFKPEKPTETNVIVCDQQLPAKNNDTQVKKQISVETDLVNDVATKISTKRKNVKDRVAWAFLGVILTLILIGILLGILKVVGLM